MLSPKVMHVRSTLGLYGAEKVLLNIAGSSNSKNISFFLIEGVTKQSSKLRKKLFSQHNKVESYQSNSKLDFNIVSNIKRCVRYNNIEIIHTHDYKSLVLASLAMFFSEVKIVHHIHGSLGNTRSEKIYALIEKIFMLRANCIITVSNEQRLCLKQNILITSKVQQINNGTPLSDSVHKSKIERSFLSLIMVARFTPEKNHKMAFDTIRDLIRAGVNIELKLLGDGETMLDMIDYVKAIKISEHVEFLGFQDNVDYYIKKSDALLITSKTEGLPMAMLEAMASGVAIISTPVGEIPNIIQASCGGFIAKSQSELLDTLSKLYRQPEELLDAGEKAKIYLEQHLSVTAQVKNLNQIYRGLVSA